VLDSDHKASAIYFNTLKRDRIRHRDHVAETMRPLLIDDAFASDHRNVLRIIKISGIVVAFFVQLTIGLSAYCKIRKDSTTSTARRAITFMFGLSFGSACLATTGLLAETALAVKLEYSCFTLHFLSCLNTGTVMIFYQTLLATLVLRLHFVFQGSEFAMSPNTGRLFAIIFLVLATSMMLVLVHQIFEVGHSFYWSSVFILASAYFVGSLLSVLFFARNLSKLAESMDVPQRQLTLQRNEVSLDVKQQKLMDLSTKYVLLFLAAILSTSLAGVFALFISDIMVHFFAAVDLSINVFCLYLQFGFATDLYRRSFRCLDSRCKALISSRMRKNLHRRHTIGSVSGSHSGSVSV